MDVSGSTVDVSGTVVDVSGMIIPNPPVDTTIITIDQLTQTQDTLVQKEAADKKLLEKISNPAPAMLTASLQHWARTGFRPNHPVIFVQLTVPPKCADGVTRTMYEYVEYLLGGTIADELAKLGLRLPGMKLLYSLDVSHISIHVTRDSTQA